MGELINKMNFKIESYGCQMNIADSELVVGILQKAGHKQVQDFDQAELVIFNTCSVREHAEQRVLGRIASVLAYKKQKERFFVGVIGCMAQRMQGELFDNGVDFVVGVDQYGTLPEVVQSLGESGKLLRADFDSEEVYDFCYPFRGSGVSAFVTVMRGCDNFCSYCIVPYLRGRERSRSVSQILADVRAAVQQGFSEITLLGQNVNSYLFEGLNFAGLLREVHQSQGVRRIRFVTSHPKDMSAELIKTMRDLPKVCPHLHVALQSGNDEILRKMNRKYTAGQYLQMVKDLRAAIPEIAITTDIIVGFPGETHSQYLDTVALLKEIRFDYAFLYKYSPRQGTKAATFAEQVPEPERLKRLQEIIQEQNKITTQKYEEQIGKVKNVLVEKVSKKDAQEIAGKSEDFKMVIFPGDKSLIGSYVQVKITKATGWTLKGEMIKEIER